MVQIKASPTAGQIKKTAGNYIRALRLPFITASIIPFICGSLLYKEKISILSFFMGLIAVAATHLGANLINDYADSRSGADWADTDFYGFFGGSKLIQEKVFSEDFYLKTSLSMLGIALFAVMVLSFITADIIMLTLFLLIACLGIFYSWGPGLSYRYLGELVIFMLFGPAVVMGGYYIQSRVFPTWEGFLLSLPFAFSTTAILFANEVPDFAQDIKAKKFNLAGLTGLKKAYLLYSALIILTLLSIVLNIRLRTLTGLSLLCFPLSIMAMRAALIIKNRYKSKKRLVESSRLTIAFQTILGLVIALDLFLKR